MLRLTTALLLGLALSGQAEPAMSWLENEHLRLGVNLDLGGAITWLSRPGETLNTINSHDWGREVQMSFYSGPIPFVAGAKPPAEAWKFLGWNPIQAGDCYGHRAQVLAVENDGRTLYVKCRPMQWPLENEPGECTFESWLTLEGASVHARGRLNNARADRTLYPARAQELPAVYTNGPFCHLWSYTGPQPGAGAPLTALEAKAPPQWGHWMATEHWSALVNDAGWGVGVYAPECTRFLGGFAGKPGAGGPSDDPTGYVAPQRDEILDHHIQYDFQYALVLGTLAEIRQFAVEREARRGLPGWSFAAARQGWTLQHASDAGWPLEGEWKVHWAAEDPALVGPLFCTRPGAVRAVVLEAAFTTPEAMGELFWSTLAQPGFAPARTRRFPMAGDGAFRTYRIELPLGADDALTQLRLDPAGGGQGEIRVRAIRLEAP